MAIGAKEVQSFSPYLVVLALCAGCGALPERVQSVKREVLSPEARRFDEMLAEAVDAARRVKASEWAKARAETRFEARPGPVRCGAVVAAHGVVDAAWAELDDSLKVVARGEGWPERRRQARASLGLVAGQRRLDHVAAEAWTARCVSLPAVGMATQPPAVVPVDYGDGLSQHGHLFVVVRPELLGDARLGLQIARWLSVRLADRFEVLLVLGDVGLKGSAVFGGPVPQLGHRRTYDRAHLPRWRGLRAALTMKTLDPAARSLAAVLETPARAGGAPWRVGVVWVTGGAPTAAEILDLRVQIEALGTPGPDGHPYRQNYHELTGGQIVFGAP